MRLGLVANRLHRREEQGGLGRWARQCAPAIRALNVELRAVGGTYDALARQSLLAGHVALLKMPYGREGGVMRLASQLVGSPSEPQALDGVVYLIDPEDPSSLYPEALALKRQCVIHGKPYLSTVAGATEWMEVEMVHAGLSCGPALLPALDQAVALIAHDARKERMVAFAAEHFDLLSRYGERVATGTTGSLLNAMALTRGWPQDRPWVQCYRSGPLGGDAQIAERILDRRCQRVIFFEDPHVARQHEADIQLLDRAMCGVTDHTVCMNSPAMAERWVLASELVARAHRLP